MILAYHTTLTYLQLQNVSFFYSLRNAMIVFCSSVIITDTYRNNKRFFSRLYCSKICYNCFLLSGKQPHVYRAAHVSSHTHTLNTTYTSIHNNKQINHPPTRAHMRFSTQSQLFLTVFFDCFDFVMYSLSDSCS